MVLPDCIIGRIIFGQANKCVTSDSLKAIFLHAAKCEVREGCTDAEFITSPTAKGAWNYKRIAGERIAGRRITCEPLEGYEGQDAKGRGRTSFGKKAATHEVKIQVKKHRDMLAIAFESDDREVLIYKQYRLARDYSLKE